MDMVLVYNTDIKFIDIIRVIKIAFNIISLFVDKFLFFAHKFYFAKKKKNQRLFAQNLFTRTTLDYNTLH